MLHKLLTGTLVESQEMIDKRLEKVFMIEDIYKLERLLDKKKTDFYHLYDLSSGHLISYYCHMSCIMMDRMKDLVAIS